VVDPPGIGAPLGRYAPGITIASNAAPGVWQLTWSWQLDAAHPVKKATQEFEVLPVGVTRLPPGPFYGMVRDVRDEGVGTDESSDGRVITAISRASYFIERVTRQFFEPRYMRMSFDGTGSKTLCLDNMPIAVEGMHFATSPLFPSDLPVEPDFFRVYNRHLGGMLSPDDRDDPRIELFSSSEDLAGIRPFTFSRLLYPRGQRNIDVVGAWGYTDPDGSPMGCTPQDIRRVAMLIALREIPQAADRDAVEDATERWRVKQMSTRDQSISLANPSAYGEATPYTGDPRIDMILERYMAPFQIAAV
jgi:hypothetical protein